MGNQTWLAEVLFAGLSQGERDHALDVMGEVTDTELRRLRARGAAKMPEPRIDSLPLQAEAGVEGVGQ
jgi:hypothetical protein